MALPKPAGRKESRSGLWKQLGGERRFRMDGRGLSIFALLLLAVPLHAAEAVGAPPFAVAHDAPLEATEKEVGRADGVIQLRVEFRGIKGDRVPAFLWLPEEKAGGATRRPAVLTQYGRGGD